MCFVFIWEQTATCATYSIKWLVFITEMKSVYSAVRTGSYKYSSLRIIFKGLRAQYRYSVFFTDIGTNLMRYQKVNITNIAGLHSERLVISISSHERKRYHVVLLLHIVTTEQYATFL